MVMKRNYILTGLLLATFLAAIEGTVIGPAGPRIVGDLGGYKLLSWVFTAYLLAMAVTTPLFGKISDLYGRKPVFIIGSILFLIGSSLCGLATTMEQLIIYRAIQGIGAGALIPVTFTIIGDIYSIEERAKVQGLISSVWGISSLVGPLLGGYMVDSLNWRYIFIFNVPFGLVALFFIIKHLHEEIEKKKAKIDIGGAVTFTVGVTTLLFALATGGNQIPWDSWMIYSLFGIAVVSLVLFFIIENRVAEPLVPLKLFKIRNIAFSNLASLLASALLIGVTSYLPLWIQGVLGKNATMSGFLLAPLSISWMLGSVLGSRMIITKGPRYTSFIGMLIIAIAALGMTTLTSNTPIYLMMLYNALYGAGFGFSISVFTIISQSSVDRSLRGASTALNSFTKSIGQTIGVTIFGVLINLSISSQIAQGTDLYGKVTQGDIDNLLSPEKLHLLPSGLLHDLVQVLQGSLHALFIVMAVIGVVGVFSSLGLSRTLLDSEKNKVDTPLDK